MTNPPRQIAFIGAGNMTQSIIGGMVKNGYPASAIYASNPSAGKLELLQSRWQVNIRHDNNEVANAADTIVLAVKPQLMAEVCRDLHKQVTNLNDKLIITIAAGIRLETYADYLGRQARVVRVMPNTPSLVGKGMSGLLANANVSITDQDFVTTIFQQVGETLWVSNEEQLDIFTAIAGSGPAYFFEFMASLQQAAVALGFNPEHARRIVEQTALGAATMAIDSDLELTELRQQVTSKGGSTAKAIEVYQASDLAQISAKAVAAAVHRNQEMAKLF